MNHVTAEKKDLILGLKQNLRRVVFSKNEQTSLAKPKIKKTKTHLANNFKKSTIQVIFESILIAIFSFVVFQSYIFTSNSPNLRISNILIHGNQYLSQAKILDWVGPLVGKNILKLELPKLVERLYQHPWTLEVSVKRILPDTLHISIAERKPFAKIILDKPYLIDRFGVLLEKTNKSYTSLPIIRGLTDINPRPGNLLEEKYLAAGLKAMHYINRLNFFKNNPINSIYFINTSRVRYVSKDKNFEIIMDLQEIEISFENLKVVLQLLSKEDLKSCSINLTFKDKAVIRQLDKPKREIFHSS